MRDALVRIGVAVAGAGLALAAAVAGLGSARTRCRIAAHTTTLSSDIDRRALAALWSALLGDLRTVGLLAAIGGVVVAVLASGELATNRLRAVAAAVRGLVRAPGTAARRARAVALVAAGVALVLVPGLTLRVAAVSAGALFVVAGAAELAGRPPDRPGAAAGARGAPLVLAAAVVAVLASTGVAIALVLPAPSAPPEAGTAPGGRATARAPSARGA